MRQSMLGGAKRIVIKIGSSVLRDGSDFDRVTFASICRGIAYLRAQGIECIVVCSGAVALGFPELGLLDRPKRIERLQASAAVGQGRLIRFWTDELNHYELTAAQVLLTHDDLKNRKRFLAARHTLRALLELGAIPIINENDTVAIEEIKMGDNDLLSSQVVSLTGASALVILSDVDGFYVDNPENNGIRVADYISEITENLMSKAGESSTGLGSGGMRTKLEAVRQVNELGIIAIIARGKVPTVLERIFAGDNLGTWFDSGGIKISRRKHWIAYAHKVEGHLTVDDGACTAITDKGRSLLPIGLTAVEGEFDVGAAVDICNDDGQPFARGLVAYDSETLRTIKGQRSDVHRGISSVEVIHRDDLVLLSSISAEIDGDK
ncbi:MAG: glutamate 5-kinase [Myxococcota bacterium]|nr:glutamate 5-kinase [Myxococcota bacterium]